MYTEKIHIRQLKLALILLEKGVECVNVCPKKINGGATYPIFFNKIGEIETFEDSREACLVCSSFVNEGTPRFIFDEVGEEFGEESEEDEVLCPCYQFGREEAIKRTINELKKREEIN